MARDYYEVLGIAKTATPEEIAGAFRKLAMLHHPDKNQGDEAAAAARFKEISEAYNTLSDPSKRSVYDLRGPSMNFRQARPRPGPAPFQQASSFEDVMQEFFGGSQYRGRNVQAKVDISFKEAMSGCSRNIPVKKRKLCNVCSGHGFTGFQPCTVCNGSGSKQMAMDGPFEVNTLCEVCGGTGKASVVPCRDCAATGFTPMSEKLVKLDIPAGIDNGMQIRVAGEGEPAKKNGRTGDLMVFVMVASHPLFKREGLDLTFDIPVSYTQLVLGTELEVPTIDGVKVKIKIPPGTQTGTRFRMKGRGIPKMQKPVERGDLVATVKCDTPKELGEEYRQLVEQLANLELNNISERRKAYAEKAAQG